MTPPPAISLRPSDGHWLYGCTSAPAYIVANAHRIPPQDTVYSVEGNLAHDCGENYILGKKAPRGATKEIKTHARVYADFCEPFKEGAQWGVEKKINLFYMPTRHGYVDFFAITARRVVIVDFKYGQGVAVNAKRNKQICIYARSLIQESFLPGVIPDELEVEMHIWQPRSREGDTHSTWKITWAELKQFTDDEVASIAELILKGGATQFLVDDNTTCRFCPVKRFCEARDQQRLNELPFLGDLIEDPQADVTVDDQMLAKIVDNHKDVIKWLEEKVEYATEMARSGHRLPGLKVVLSKGAHRAWTDSKAAAKLLRTHFSRKVLYKEPAFATPKQIEDAMDAAHLPEDFVKQVEALIHKPEGKPVLASVDDPRPEYGAVSLDEFDDLDAVKPEPDTDWL